MRYKDLDKLKAKRARWYQRHKAKILLKRKLYYEEHKPEIAKRTARWWAAHPDKLKAKRKRQRLTRKVRKGLEGVEIKRVSHRDKGYSGQLKPRGI